MPLTGISLYVALAFLATWFTGLCWTCWRLVRTKTADSSSPFRRRLTIIGIVFSALAVGALLLMHVSWLSVQVSQPLGARTIGILSLPLFWGTALGLVLCSAGSGNLRFAGVGTCLLTGAWWFTMAIGAGISGGASVIRHPIRFLIPEGYVGWVGIEYGDESAPPLPVENGALACRIPENGLLRTSSRQEGGWAKDQHFYYSDDGSLRPLEETGWGAGGMIWGPATEERVYDGSGKMPAAATYYFYVGTEEQYHHAVSRTNEPHPFVNENKR